MDVPHCNIAMYFSESSEFIEEGLKNGGKVILFKKLRQFRNTHFSFQEKFLSIVSWAFHVQARVS